MRAPTQRDVMNLISRIAMQGLPVDRVLIARSLWWDFLEDCPSASFTGPLQVQVWGIPCIPADLPPGETMRTEAGEIEVPR